MVGQGSIRGVGMMIGGVVPGPAVIHLVGMPRHPSELFPDREFVASRNTVAELPVTAGGAVAPPALVFSTLFRIGDGLRGLEVGAVPVTLCGEGEKALIVLLCLLLFARQLGGARVGARSGAGAAWNPIPRDKVVHLCLVAALADT
jgi:hypothetical protein